MKVLHILDNLDQGGGTETMFVNMLPQLVEAGVKNDVLVLFSRTYGGVTFCDRVRPQVTTLDCQNWPRFYAFIPLWMGAIVWKGWRGKYDVIHARLDRPSLALGMARLFLPRRTATVISFHSFTFDLYRWRSLRKRIFKFWLSFVFRNFVDGYAGNSPRVAQHYGSHLGLSGVRGIPNAIDLARFPFQADSELPGRSEGYLRAIVPARLIRTKGHMDLLRALALLKGKGLRLRVELLGNGDLEEELCALAKDLDVSELVSFRGNVPNDEMPAIYRQAQLMILPSHGEGFPMSIVESLACGCPVIATEVGGIPDILEEGHNGFLCRAKDPESLAAAIERFHAFSGKSELRRKGRETVEARFDIKRVRQQWVDFYREMTLRRRRGIP